MSKTSTSQKTQRSKRKIQNILKQEGPQDASYLAEILGVTAMAVRQHLYALMDEKLVTYQEVPRPKGRPAKLWQLTEEANRLFPDTHAELSLSLLDQMKSIFGEEGLNQIIEKRGAEQLHAYQEQLAGLNGIKPRLEAFATIRTEEGYMAFVQKDPHSTDLFFIENHCPICAAATACQNLCAKELDIICQLFPECSIHRDEYIMNGSHRCAYRVSEKPT